MSPSAPLAKSYFNNYIIQPNLYANLPKYHVLCDDDKYIYVMWRCNQRVVIPKPLRDINRMGLSAPWDYSNFKNFILSPTLDHHTLI